MGLVDYFSCKPEQHAAKILTYDEKFIIPKIDAIKSGSKPFLLNAKIYTIFAPQIQQ